MLPTYIYTKTSCAIYFMYSNIYSNGRQMGIREYVGNALHTQLRIQGNNICASARTHNMDSGVVLFGGGWFHFGVRRHASESPIIPCVMYCALLRMLSLSISLAVALVLQFSLSFFFRHSHTSSALCVCYTILCRFTQQHSKQAANTRE